MSNTHCGNYSNYQFGRSFTCKVGDWQCPSCQLIDAESKIAELENKLNEYDTEERDAAYAMLDHYLRNQLGDDDYENFSQALNTLY